MKKVLILCTGNSCRSIMAEAQINHYLKGLWQAYSAGTHPSMVHPRSLQVLQEKGIDTGYLKSKGIMEFFYIDDIDLVITVCDHAKDNCPVFPRLVKSVHIGIDDPVIYAEAPDEEALQKFRECRDEIKSKIVDRLDMTLRGDK